MSSLVPHRTFSLFSAQQPEWPWTRKRRPCRASGLSSPAASGHLWWNPKFWGCLFGFCVTWALPVCRIFFSFSLCVAKVASFLAPRPPPPPRKVTIFHSGRCPCTPSAWDFLFSGTCVAGSVQVSAHVSTQRAFSWSLCRKYHLLPLFSICNLLNFSTRPLL